MLWWIVGDGTYGEDNGSEKREDEKEAERFHSEEVDGRRERRRGLYGDDGSHMNHECISVQGKGKYRTKRLIVVQILENSSGTEW